MPRNTSTGSALQKFNARPQAAGAVAVVTSRFQERRIRRTDSPRHPTPKESGSDTRFPPRRSFQQHQDHAVDHRCQRPKGDDRPGYGEHLRRHTGDESLWLCQDRHTVFSEFFSRLQSGGAYCFSLPLQMQTRSKYAYLSQSLLKGTHEPALQNF